ncbi:ABC transporter permease [Paenibacillus sp. strain BS8-2]
MRWMRQWEIQLMILPGLLFLLVFNYVPMYGVIVAFKDYNLFKGFLESPWAGMKHFDMFFNSLDFWRIIRNTVVISGLKLLFGFPAPIILALLLNEIRNRYFKQFIQTVTYMPHFLSWVVVGGFALTILSADTGSLNEILLKLGWIDESVAWLSKPNYFWEILIAANIWKEIGFASIVYLAAIAGVDPSLYEAASIDGASRSRQIFAITIPSIMPIIIIFLILQIGNLLNAGFEDILMLTSNGMNAIMREVGDVIDTYVYRIGIQNQRFSYAAAAGLFKSLINILLLVAANRFARRLGHSLW